MSTDNVELKRGRLGPTHEKQLARYLDNARESTLLKSYLDRGAALSGVLATVEKGDFIPKRKDIAVIIVDRQKVIDHLKRTRTQNT